jgi:RecA/RadA recombinase
MQALNCSQVVARQYLQDLYDATAPPPKTALAMVSEYRRLTQRVQTPLAHLTEALLGGFGPTIYEAAGPAGAGKTQFALSTVAAAVVSSLCAPQAAADAGGPKYVVYVDTEGAFDAARLREIIEARLLERMPRPLCAEPRSVGCEGGILAGWPEACGVAVGPGVCAEEPRRSAMDLDSSIVDSTVETPFDRQVALNGALAAVLQRVIVYQATSVAEVARICAELPATISVTPIGLDRAADATADSAAPMLAGSVVGDASAAPSAPNVDAKLGLVVIDSIASASRKEFDGAAGSGSRAAGATRHGWQVASGPGSSRGAVADTSGSSSGEFANVTNPETAAGLAWQRSEALTRLASVLKGICERHLVPVLVTNQIATAVPPARSARAAFLGVAAAADDGDDEDGADAFAEWAGTWLEETLVPALGPIWSHSVVSSLSASGRAGHNHRVSPSLGAA